MHGFRRVNGNKYFRSYVKTAPHNISGCHQCIIAIVWADQNMHQWS